ncbi:MAG: ABC transporter substrate-binding protein, partial [Thermoflexibacteraceae bacterium]
TNPEFDSLYTVACAEKNDSLRHEVYRRMEQIVMNEAPVIPIYYDESLQLSQRRVTGLLRGGAYNLKLEKIGIITEK